MDKSTQSVSDRRVPILYVLLVAIGLIFVARLFYLQVIKHDYYAAQATAAHESKFSIPAERGAIYALDGDHTTPLVLNENLPTVFADPRYIENPEDTAKQLAAIIGGEESKYLELLKSDTSYAVLQKKLDPSKAKALKEADLKGIGMTDAQYRVYPQGSLGAQVLGFVNDEGEGQYGIESYLNSELTGKPGRLKAVTDVYGIPLASNEDNIVEDPENGAELTLTIDINLQRHVEKALAAGVKRVGAPSGSAVVYDPHTGAVKAMANYPSFDPAKFSETKDFSRFSNQVVSGAYETGSGMKIFSMSTGLNEGAVTPNTSFYDSGSVTVDGERITNAGNRSFGRQDMKGVIQNSINTGIIYVLQRLGGGEINERGRKTIHDYFTQKFGFGSATGVEQANESAGYVAGVNTGSGDNVRYANMVFGQGMTVTMLQMAAAAGSAVTGNYYQPYLVQARRYSDGRVQNTEPKILRANVTSNKTRNEIKNMMRGVVENGGGYTAKRAGYFLGGKTGTAQIPGPNGGYVQGREIGSFTGFGASKRVDYIIMTRVNDTRLAGYAGSEAAAPIFADISNFMIDYYQIPPGS